MNGLVQFVPFSLTALLVGLVLFGQLGRFAPWPLVLVIFLAIAIFVADYTLQFGLFTTFYVDQTGPEATKFGPVGQLIAGVILGGPLLLGAAIGWIWGALRRRRVAHER